MSLRQQLLEVCRLDKLIANVLLEAVKARPGLSVKDLVDEVAEGLGVGGHVVAKHLYWLWKEEAKVRLVNPRPPSTLRQYAMSLYNLWFWLLAILVALTASAIYLFPQGPPYIYLRYALGPLFVLYLPGFALIESLFPRRGDLPPLERLVLSIGLSLALVPLVGLLLNYTPWGIRLGPIFVSMASLTVALAAAAAARKFSYFKMEIQGNHGLHSQPHSRAR